MEYKMEELVPIVGNLAQKYTSYEHSSISYERAEQLMEAVLYCIQEAERFSHNSLISGNEISAQKAYETGVMYIQEKVKKALQLYNEISSDFVFFENVCFYDTVVKGIPEFFKWYDIQFDPQNTILTLDYPILKDISAYSGIDKIYEYIFCIHLEQKFLKAFPENYVKNILS